MKKLLFNITTMIVVLSAMVSCQDTNYPGGTISPYIGIFDLRNLYKGEVVTIDAEKLDGSSKLAALVVSDHKGGNLPEGLLVVQDARRLGKLRGISIDLGASAENYQPGDSVVIDIVGSQLLREGGILKLKNVKENHITKVASGRPINNNVVTAKAILENLDAYESTLVIILKGGFNPIPKEGEVLSGTKLLNDGFANLNLVTNEKANFSQQSLYVLGNYYGIVFNKEAADGTQTPYLKCRTKEDILLLSSEIEIAPIVITGFASDVKGSDTNYEYMQFMATEDIDFAKTPYAVVVSNNANASTPTGAPINGWATGGMRTYKFNITKGFAAKGTYFYVGGKYQLINGGASTSLSTSNWVLNYDYNENNGFDFGNRTSGLLANSGNAFGIAIFKGTSVTKDSKPIDVMFNSGGGALWEGDKGYRITNSDFYDVINPLTMQPQPFFKQGTNQLFLKYNTADVGYFVSLGGEYNRTLGRWTVARSQNNIEMTKTSLITDIEYKGATKIVE
ncbi:DUF5689 domain-containing protein [Sphingobacterium sp. SRCM116780]|uniref:DUF5689 domain-containing protein n=1 Tax=Sphingobacterium sp. SRCM116780 TaxID=2907623 RepID=UPI001F2EBE9D|nr:DUF5689 domain-containing protein [Sphingobacterium sp. SRCM116780]UIR55904.1 DUF5689 domain-containing protein [Sphingobacterium sp. SRCM116780]